MSRQWTKRWRVGRVQFGWHIYKHTSGFPTTSDRWVLHPQFVYDRKRRNTHAKDA